jgi:hypothetical protein
MTWYHFETFRINRLLVDFETSPKTVCSGKLAKVSVRQIQTLPNECFMNFASSAFLVLNIHTLSERTILSMMQFIFNESTLNFMAFSLQSAKQTLEEQTLLRGKHHSIFMCLYKKSGFHSSKMPLLFRYHPQHL